LALLVQVSLVGRHAGVEDRVELVAVGAGEVEHDKLIHLRGEYTS
jgi:hypothetical protein